jgi:Membrane bound beta barrel domain (DUF5777)
MKPTRLLILLLSVVVLALPQPVAAQNPRPAPPPDDPDRDINLSQPDFTLVALPTTLRVPRFRSAFRVTHRFTRPLGQGDFGDLASDFFAIDSGAVIGLEYRFGLMRGLQVGIHRNNDRTIELFTHYNLLQQGTRGPVGLDVVGSIEGTNNMGLSGPEETHNYTPAIGVALSRELGRHGAVYVEPMWVNNSNPLPKELTDDNDTFLVGLGLRVRVLSTMYLVGEYTPRTGYKPGVNQGSFGIEKRLGGHVFQLNFSNGFGTTMGQIARGGTSNDDWYMGFNISRKFY